MITCTDQLHRTIILPDVPKRIISLVPSQTELLADLGLGARVVGITKFCVRPKEWFQNKTRIGGTKNYHIDRIRQLNPDLIIGNKEENDQEQVEKLMKDFPVWMSDIKNLTEALNMIKSLGVITGASEMANQIRFNIQNAFANLDLQTRQSTPKKAAYLIWHQPLMIAGGDTFIHHMMEKAGFSNVMANQNRYPQISISRLQSLNPDYILLSSEPFPFKAKHLTFYEQHFPEAQVQLVDGELFSWYGSRLQYSAPYFQQLREGGG